MSTALVLPPIHAHALPIILVRLAMPKSVFLVASRERALVAPILAHAILGGWAHFVINQCATLPASTAFVWKPLLLTKLRSHFNIDAPATMAGREQTADLVGEIYDVHFSSNIYYCCLVAICAIGCLESHATCTVPGGCDCYQQYSGPLCDVCNSTWTGADCSSRLCS